jgi:hypothetical protein
MSMDKPMLSGDPTSGLVAPAVEYMIDAGQRSVLFLDILRQRGDQYREHAAQTAPHVLQYATKLVVDGRNLDEPVNYALVRILPPKGVEIEATAVHRRRPPRGTGIAPGGGVDLDQKGRAGWEITISRQLSRRSSGIQAKGRQACTFAASGIVAAVFV